MSQAKLPQKLNNEQLTAVKHKSGPLLIVAGAGTGKTTVITERISWLVAEKLAKTDEILALTFTDKAAGEMEERVDRLLPYGYTDLWIMTFHSFCERILKNHGLDIGLPNDFKLLNQTEQWLLVRQNLEKFNLDYYQPLGNPTKFIHALIKHFSRCKDEEIWPKDYLEYVEKLKIDLDSMESLGGAVGTQKTQKAQKAQKTQKDSDDETDSSEIKRLEEVANAYHTYQQLLLDNENLDFGDLINYTLKLFRRRPHILRQYQNKFKYILVDEFQDTNFAQYELVKLLAGDKQNLTVVGDDDQAIYKFRGASVSNILQFKDDFPQAQEIFLTKNYRSSQNILDLAYNFIQLNNPERLEAKLAQTAQKQKNTQSTKNIQAQPSLSKKLRAETAGSGEIEILEAADENAEVEAVINKIIGLKNSDPNCSWNDFALLVRANSQAEPFLNGLRARAIPQIYLAAKGLYNKEVVRDILAYLKLLDNYHESLALWRILNLDLLGIKVEDLMELTRYASRKALSLFEVARQIDALRSVAAESQNKIKKVLALLEKHTALAREKTVKEVVHRFLADFGYQDYLMKREAYQSFGFVQNLLKKIDEFEKAGDDKSVAGFMRLVGLELESGEQGDLPAEADAGPEAVKVMTVHAAKGLEFKYVFVVNLADKRFPSIERKEPIEVPDELVKEILPAGDVHLQEERRLFYVAMTRAKQGLYLSRADNYGGKTKKKASRFLYEVGLTTKNTESIKTQPAQGWSASGGKAQKQEIKDSFENKKLPITNYQLPNSFSYSQLKAFETCPYQYYLNYILKVPTPGSAVFSYGKTMHLTLQKFFALIKQTGNSRQGDLFTKNRETRPAPLLPALNKLLDIYKASWIDDWYESKKQKEEYKQLGQRSLKGFYEAIQHEPPKVRELEKSFNLKIGGHTLRGVMDRVDEIGDGKIRIVDYKTGRPRSKKTVEKDQLLIYQLAAVEVFGWPVQELMFYYLDNNSQVAFLGTPKEIDKLKQKILGLIAAIQAADWRALPGEHNCKYCDYREICRFAF